jgi:hypothetical protein
MRSVKRRTWRCSSASTGPGMLVRVAQARSGCIHSVALTAQRSAGRGRGQRRGTRERATGQASSTCQLEVIRNPAVTQAHLSGSSP